MSANYTPTILVGGKKRDEVLSAHKKRLEEMANDSRAVSPRHSSSAEAMFESIGTYDFAFECTEQRTTINGIWYFGECYHVALYNNIDVPPVVDRKWAPPAGKSCPASQNIWIANNPRVFDLVLTAPFYAQIIKTAYDHRNDPAFSQDINRWRELIRPLLCAHRLWTTTTVDIDTSLYRVHHHEKEGPHSMGSVRNDEHSCINAVYGSEIKSLGPGFTGHSLVEDSMNDFGQALQWLTGKSPQFIFPTVGTNNGVSFGPATEGRYILDATCHPDNEYPALRAIISKIVLFDKNGENNG